MKHIWVRPATQDDLPKLQNWITENPRNEFDPDVFTYPETTVLCAHHGEPVLYLPIQIAAILESLAPNPDASPLELAEALKNLLVTVGCLAKSRGIHELYFLSTDPAVDKIALNHGFEELPYKVLRIKLDKVHEPND